VPDETTDGMLHSAPALNAFMKTKSQPCSLRASGFVASVATFLALCLFASGCTTLQSVALPTPGPAPAGKAFAVHVGDSVEIQTKAGPTLTFKVTAVEPDALVGEKVRVKYDDMSTLQVRRIAKGYTAMTAGAVVSTILLVGLIYALAHMGPGMSGG
jgi:hypothetical protein